MFLLRVRDFELGLRKSIDLVLAIDDAFDFVHPVACVGFFDVANVQSLVFAC